MSNYIHANVIEEKANYLLREYYKRDNKENIEIPIDPIDIAESFLDLTVDFGDIEENDKTIFGALYPKSKTIRINGKYEYLYEEKEGFLNFTCAHEIGHWILHVDQNEENQSTFNFAKDMEFLVCREKERKNPIEIQADMFAANLLMPRDNITKDINEIKARKKITWKDLYEIREKYNVTISALCIRVTVLNLLYIEDRNIYNSRDEALGQLSFL